MTDIRKWRLLGSVSCEILQMVGEALTFRTFPTRKMLVNPFSIVLTFLILSSPAVLAQRGGRADATPNSLGRNKNARLLLQVKYGKKRLYFRFSDLQKKVHSAVKLTDPTTGQLHVYEGVSIKNLVPGGVLIHQSGSLEISAEHKKKVTVLCSNLDFNTLPVVADTVDGKKLTGYVPYYFVVQAREGFAGPFPNVKMIEVKPSADVP